MLRRHLAGCANSETRFKAPPNEAECGGDTGGTGALRSSAFLTLQLRHVLAIILLLLLHLVNLLLLLLLHLSQLRKILYRF